MNTKSKTILSILLPVFILGAIITIYYVKQPSDVKNKKSDFQIASRVLNKEFIINDSIAYAKYGNKIIELTGTIANIKESKMHGIIITLDNPDMGIKCVMDSTIKTIPADVTIGSTVSIKGICVGSDQLIGVLINQCFITDNKASLPNP